GLERFEAPLQRSARWPDQRSDTVGDVPRRADTEALDSVGKRVAKRLVVVQFALEQQQRCGAAFLSRMSEGGVDDVFDRLVAVGQRRDDRRVLAAGFGDEFDLAFAAQ